MPKKSEWFEEWFDSKYYHLLYKERDEHEAKQLVSSLADMLHLAPQSRILDLGCGKGRHARHLAHLGFDVTGLDISANSITEAQKTEHDYLHFYVHDMRLPFRINYFHAVVSFFTSFGYFRTDAEHLQTLRHIQNNLLPGGTLLLDFFNPIKIRKELVRKEEKTVQGVYFVISRYIRKGYVCKKITFNEADSTSKYTYTEKVRLFTLQDFNNMFEQNDLQLTKVFGDYSLSDYDPSNSSRMILLATKK